MFTTQQGEEEALRQAQQLAARQASIAEEERRLQVRIAFCLLIGEGLRKYCTGGQDGAGAAASETGGREA